MMVSMAIGLIILSAMGFVFLSSTRVFQALEASSRIQENVRYTFEQISRDVRMAGFTGCSHLTTANVLNGATGWQYNLFGRAVHGTEAGGTFPTGVSNVLRGDGLTILEADNSQEYIVSSHNPSLAQFQLTANHNIKQGEILVVTDCSHAAVFQVTNVNNTIATVNHNTGNSTVPGNCTKGFGLPVDCSSTNGVSYTFPPGSRLLRLRAVTYYIRANGSGEPALYRQVLGATSGNASNTAEELVEGIEDMQIVYGVDTTGTADGVVDTYVTASQVPTTAPGANLDEQWARVLAVRVSLIGVSSAGQEVMSQIVPFQFNGATVTPVDRLMRKVFTTTIAVRNRL
jgi:type IV pilus assembly protein PilW